MCTFFVSSWLVMPDLSVLQYQGTPAIADTKYVYTATILHSYLTRMVSAPGQGANAFWAVGTGMVRSEGPLSLTNGFAASMMRELVYSGFRLGTYEFFKDTYVRSKQFLVLLTQAIVSLGGIRCQMAP